MNAEIAFPMKVYKEVSLMSGNEYCFNCNALGTGWACVMHGTVICLDCAGKHRSLGVRISFVRSLTMDKWTQHQIDCMRFGGNSKLRSYFNSINMNPRSFVSMYESEEAEKYRNALKAHVNNIAVGILSPDTPFSCSDDSPKSENSTPKSSDMKRVRVLFQEGSLGLTLTKEEYSDKAVVSRLTSGGQAAALGVMVGDVVGIATEAGGWSSKYDFVSQSIPQYPRPLTLEFQQANISNSVLKSESSNSESTVSTPVNCVQQMSIEDTEEFGEVVLDTNDQQPVNVKVTLSDSSDNAASSTPGFISSVASTHSSDCGVDNILHNYVHHGDKDGVSVKEDIKDEMLLDNCSRESRVMAAGISTSNAIYSSSSSTEDLNELSLSSNSLIDRHDATLPSIHPTPATVVYNNTWDYTVTFPKAPLGLTIAKSPLRGVAEVVHVYPNSLAHRHKVCVGDVVMCINDHWIGSGNYDLFIRLHSAIKQREGGYPVTLTFRRGVYYQCLTATTIFSSSVNSSMKKLMEDGSKLWLEGREKLHHILDQPSNGSNGPASQHAQKSTSTVDVSTGATTLTPIEVSDVQSGEVD